MTIIQKGEPMSLIDPIALKQALAVSTILEDKKTIEQIIDEQPTIEPEPHWIPCSERLPDTNGDYLVTGRHGAVDKRGYEDGYWYGNWSVIAWMPLPEPYKGKQ